MTSNSSAVCGCATGRNYAFTYQGGPRGGWGQYVTYKYVHGSRLGSVGPFPPPQRPRAAEAARAAILGLGWCSAARERTRCNGPKSTKHQSLSKLESNIYKQHVSNHSPPLRLAPVDRRTRQAARRALPTPRARAPRDYEHQRLSPAARRQWPLQLRTLRCLGDPRAYVRGVQPVPQPLPPPTRRLGSDHPPS